MELGFEVWFQKGCGLDRCFPSLFGIVVKFPRQKSGSISPYFHGGNLAMFRLRGIKHTKHYFHQAFTMKIWQRRCPIFTEKIWQSFTFGALWHTSRASFLCIRRVPTCLCWDKSEPLKASSILMRVTYTRKPMTLRWHGSRQSHNDDLAHNIVWICTYSKCLKCILTQQGHEHLWSWLLYLPKNPHLVLTLGRTF